MKKIDIKEICKKHAEKLSNGFYYVPVEDGSFAEACFNDNTEDELIEALQQRAADKTDCANWNITPTQWRHSIEEALAKRIISDNDDQLPE